MFITMFCLSIILYMLVVWVQPNLTRSENHCWMRLLMININTITLLIWVSLWSVKLHEYCCFVDVTWMMVLHRSCVLYWNLELVALFKSYWLLWVIAVCIASLLLLNKPKQCTISRRWVKPPVCDPASSRNKVI